MATVSYTTTKLNCIMVEKTLNYQKHIFLKLHNINYQWPQFPTPLQNLIV